MKTKILLGLLIVGIILVSGCVQEQPKLNITEAIAEYELNFQNFYNQEIMQERGEVYFAGEIGLLYWSWTGPFRYGFNNRIPIIGDVSELEANLLELEALEEKQIIAYGYFENLTLEVPTRKDPSSKIINQTFRVFHLKNVSVIRFSELEYPENITENDEFNIILKITNPFADTLELNIYFEPYGLSNFEFVKGNIKIFETFNPGETKTFKWRLKAIRSGPEVLTTSIFGKSERRILLSHNHYDILVLALPRIHIKLESIPRYVQVGEEFTVSAFIENIGDFGVKGVSAILTLPSSISTNESLKKKIGDLPAGESITVNWTAKANELGSYGYDVFAQDRTRKYKDKNSDGVIVFEEGHEIDVLIEGTGEGAGGPYGISGEVTKTTTKDTWVNFTITIQNKGSRDDLVDVNAYLSYMGWKAKLYDKSKKIHTPYSLSIPANSSHDLILSLKPYEGEEVGKEIHVKVYVISQKDRTKKDTVIARAVIVER